MLAPAALSLVSVTFAHDAGERGRAFGMFGTVAGAGGAFRLLLGGILTQTVSWRVFLFVTPSPLQSTDGARPGGAVTALDLRS
jgi:MFS family permease